jgi:lysine-N-methylase
MTQAHCPKNIATLVPSYVTKFQCLGKECPDTCCAGWTVSIDRKSYKLYQSINVEMLKDKLKKFVHRNRKSASESNYAYIEMQGCNNSCPLLVDKLCSIQLEKGERHLSNTCATFPRRTTHMAGTTEQTLSLSCPEAARLALLDPEALELTQSVLEIRPSTVENLEFSQPRISDLLVLARAAILTILKDEKYQIHELLTIIIIFLEEFNTRVKNQDQDGARVLIQETVEGVRSFSFPLFESSSKFHQNQIQICLELFRFKENFSESKFFSSLATHAQNGASLEESYVRGLASMKNNPTIQNIILRNYCAHEIFQSKIPCVTGDAAGQLGAIIVNFYLIKTVMAISLGSCKPHEETDLAVTLIKDFTKGYQHDSYFRSAITELINRMNWKNIERVQSLLIV